MGLGTRHPGPSRTFLPPSRQLFTGFNKADSPPSTSHAAFFPQPNPSRGSALLLAAQPNGLAWLRSCFLPGSQVAQAGQLGASQQQGIVLLLLPFSLPPPTPFCRERVPTGSESLTPSPSHPYFPLLHFFPTTPSHCHSAFARIGCPPVVSARSQS